MSKKASPTLIGSFVLGAILLVIIGIAYLGTIKFNDQSKEFVLFFNESVNGLDIGSRVKYQGVPIGEVTKIAIRLPNQLPEYSHIPVVIEVDPKTLKNLGAWSQEVEIGQDASTEKRIASGMRGQLQVESLITGLLYIEIDIKENAPPPVWIQDPKNKLYNEIPTVPSPFAALGQSAHQILAKLGAIEWDKLIQNITQIVSNVQGITEDFDVKELTNNLNKAISAIDARVSDKKLDELVTNLNEAVTAIQDRFDDKKLDQSVEKLSRLFDNANNFVTKANSQLDPFMQELKAVASDLEKTLASARSALTQIENTGKSAQAMMSSDSSLRFRLENALMDFAAAAKSVERLADQIERNPKSILTGKAQ